MRRPLSGAAIGIVIGLAAAIIIQQQGIWPLDRITVFLLPGLTGLLGMVITSIGRAAGSTTTLVIALILTIPLVAWGVIGLTEINEQGQLNGGCTVVATSGVDQTNVTDTTRSDPFEIDPNGELTWAATSPSVFDDYAWEIWTEIGGVQITLESETNQNNDEGSQENGDTVGNVTSYAESQGIDIDEIRGVIIVGGQAAGTCDGFGFVKLTSDPFETIVSQIALAILILFLILLIVVALTGRGAAAAGAAGGAAVAGSGEAQPDDGPQSGSPDDGSTTATGDEGENEAQELMDDIRDAADESGFGKDVKG